MSDELGTRRRAITSTVIGAIVVAAGGLVLAYFGSTFVEPEQRSASRPVPAIAPKLLTIAGIALVTVAIAWLVRGLLRTRKN